MAAEGSDAAFETYVADRYAALCRLAHAMCGDRHHAEDIVQTALAKVYEAHRRGRAPDLDAAARRTLLAVHARTRYRRRGGEWPAAGPPWVADWPAGPQTGGIAAVDLRRTLLAALGRLPAGQRAVLALRFLEDLSERETAETLGVSTGTVKSRTSRALAALRQVEGLRELTVSDGEEAPVGPR
ncbi:MAG: SigE family RNA polymerase sigma factor [Frankiaceae bacterium]